MITRSVMATPGGAAVDLMAEDRDDVTDGPCGPWPVDPACCPGFDPNPANWTPQQQTAVDIATDTLWRLTAGRYGLCEEVVRPCRDSCGAAWWTDVLKGPAGAGGLMPYIEDGRWYNRSCGCSTGCACGSMCTVSLPGPVYRVVEVKVDGAPVDDWKLLRYPGKWQLARTGVSPVPPLDLVVRPDKLDPTEMSVIATVDNGGLGPVDTLTFGDGTAPDTDVPENTDTGHTYTDPGTYTVVATDSAEVPPADAGACWPACQNLLLPDSEPDTFSVRYLRGKPVPKAGIRAVSVLACELVKQCTGAKGCRLPERVRSVSREGVSFDMFDPGEWLESGLTGLREIDAWLRSVNPSGVRTPPAVYSLDLPAAPLVEGRYAPGDGL